MTYLLCEVADQGLEGYWGDWFDFLWNRMRGIRKVSRIYMGLGARKPVFMVPDQLTLYSEGVQWLSGRVLDSRLRDRRFEPHRRH